MCISHFLSYLIPTLSLRTPLLLLSPFLSLSLHPFFNLRTFIPADRLAEMWATRLESHSGSLKSAELLYTSQPQSLEIFRTFPRANLHHECGLGCLFQVTLIYRESVSLFFSLTESNSLISRLYSPVLLELKSNQNPLESNKNKDYKSKLFNNSRMNVNNTLIQQRPETKINDGYIIHYSYIIHIVRVQPTHFASGFIRFVL